jgi:hypothetical protein
MQLHFLLYMKQRYLSLVVHVLPWCAELYNMLWFRYPLKYLMLLELYFLTTASRFSRTPNAVATYAFSEKFYT